MTILLLAGCSLTKAIERRYSEIDPRQGVEREQAVVVAQRELLNSTAQRRFKVSNPAVLDDRLVAEFPDYWFVEFYPKNEIDDSFWRFLIVVAKKDGEVIYRDAYRPLRISDYGWVFK